jgi:cyclophilin family peptidyl-prolyl cis-trans isomerase
MRRATLLACAWLAAACGGEAPALEEPPVRSEDLVREGSHETAVLTLEELGTIRIELLPELAPETVAHFKKLVEEGLYDGTTFHRVIPGFMIQGGDPLTKNIDPRDDGRGGTDYEIADEFSAMPHTRGVVSLANRRRHNSAGSQFFIVHQDTPHLDGSFTAFARVVEGIEVVDAVTELAIDKYGRYGPRDRPYPKHARIASIRIEPAEPSQLGLPATSGQEPGF